MDITTISQMEKWLNTPGGLESYPARSPLEAVIKAMNDAKNPNTNTDAIRKLCKTIQANFERSLATNFPGAKVNWERQTVEGLYSKCF